MSNDLSSIARHKLKICSALTAPRLLSNDIALKKSGH